MVTLLHISDLHFGLARARMLRDAILRAESDIGPSAVVCSGDLVEWSELTFAWREVEAFLNALASPVLVVPGNHDIPRANVIDRVLSPFAKFRRFVQSHAKASLDVPGARIIALPTPRRWSLDLGHVSQAQLDEVRAVMRTASDGVLKVVAMHHPLLPERGWLRNHVWGAERVRRELLDIRADLVLSGHAHFPRVEELRNGTHAMIWAQAGSAGSSRLRRKLCTQNSLTVIRKDARELVIEWWYYADDTGRFTPGEVMRHELG